MKMKVELLVLAQKISGALAEWQVYPYGEVMTDEGPILVDEQAMDLTIAYMEKRGNDIVIDYEHQTLYGGEAPAAGKIKRLINKGKEGFWAQSEWTERAKGYLDRKEYFYFSPVSFRRKSDNRLIGIHSVALTNAPKTHNIQALVAKAAPEYNSTQEETMDRKQMIEILKLKQDATDAEILAAIAALQQSGEQVVSKDVADALGLSEKASKSEVVATVLALKQHANVVPVEEFKAMQKTIAEGKRDTLVSKAITEKKITPAQKEWAENYAMTDPKGFELFISKAPVVIDTTERGGGKGPDREGALDDAQMLINKQLGVTEESFKKFNKVS